MIDTTWTCRAGADKVNENRGASEETSVRGHAARKHQKKLGDLEFGPWLGQASMLVVDDEPGMRGDLVRTLGPLCKRIEKTFDTKARRASVMPVCITRSHGVPGQSEPLNSEFRLSWR